MVGVACVMGASAISGLSTALTQRALSSGRNGMFFSAELAFFGIIVLVGKDLFKVC